MWGQASFLFTDDCKTGPVVTGRNGSKYPGIWRYPQQFNPVSVNKSIHWKPVVCVQTESGKNRIHGKIKDSRGIPFPKTYGPFRTAGIIDYRIEAQKQLFFLVDDAFALPEDQGVVQGEFIQGVDPGHLDVAVSDIGILPGTGPRIALIRFPDLYQEQLPEVVIVHIQVDSPVASVGALPQLPGNCLSLTREIQNTDGAVLIVSNHSGFQEAPVLTTDLIAGHRYDYQEDGDNTSSHYQFYVKILTGKKRLRPPKIYILRPYFSIASVLRSGGIFSMAYRRAVRGITALFAMTKSKISC